MVTALTLTEILHGFTQKNLSDHADAVLIEAQLTVDQLMRTMKRCGETSFTVATMTEPVTLETLVAVGDLINDILNRRYGCND